MRFSYTYHRKRLLLKRFHSYYAVWYFNRPGPRGFNWHLTSFSLFNSSGTLFLVMAEQLCLSIALFFLLYNLFSVFSLPVVFVFVKMLAESWPHYSCTICGFNTRSERFCLLFSPRLLDLV